MVEQVSGQRLCFSQLDTDGTDIVFTDPDSLQPIRLDLDLSQLYAKQVGQWRDGECQHAKKELRKGFNKGGGPIVQLQCLDCGMQIGKLEKRTPETDRLSQIDEERHSEYQSQRRQELDSIKRKFVALQTARWKDHAKGDSYFRSSHNEYLNSPEWGERRTLVMQRAGGLCEGCRKSKATEVHHLTYKNWGAEFLFELVALCGSCHDRIHRRDEDRATGCTDCIHAADSGAWCQRYSMPTAVALLENSYCGPEREGFTALAEFE